MKILMICLGNICRSPLAEGILQHRAKQAGLDWVVDSAGIGDWHRGQSPDQRSIKVALKHGIDISKQRARQVAKSDFDVFDHIFVMDDQNQRDALRLAGTPEQRKKISLILDQSHPGEHRNVPDPYYDDEAAFERVFEMLDVACASMID